jgi:hypothetical protein
VIVCTDKRGVIFGYCSDTSARPILLTSARMCLYWSADVGGVFGLGEIGPNKNCKISAPLSTIALEGVTAIFFCRSRGREGVDRGKSAGPLIMAKMIYGDRTDLRSGDGDGYGSSFK